MNNPHRQYFEYLSRRSWLGRAYRRYWLYPKLCRHLHGRVLDVGCGIGDMLQFRPGTIGVDVNPETVAACLSKGLLARVMQPDQLPFGDETFDSVVLDNVLEHLADPSALLVEIRRVLVPAGTLVVGVPGARGYRADADHKVFYDAKALQLAVGTAGFDMRLIFRMPLNVPWLENRLNADCLYGVFIGTGAPKVREPRVRT